jgi:hypothetical protein
MPKYTWDAENLHYIDEDGEPMPDETVRAWVDAAVDEAKARVVEAAEQLNADELKPYEWHEKTDAEISAMHVALGIVAIGGLAALTRTHLSRIKARVDEQKKYLLGFKIAIELGIQRKDGSLLNRASMYADSGVHTYENIKREMFKDKGFDEEHSHLDSGAQHCQTCPQESAKGWVSIGTLIPPGGRDCRSKCRCWLTYRKVARGS